DRVVRADEVDRLASHGGEKALVLMGEGGRDAEVADPALLLHLPQNGQLDGEIAHVVDLYEIDHRFADALERGLELAACRGRPSPSARGQDALRRPAELAGNPELLCDLSCRYLRGAIGGSRVEHGAAERDHLLEHCFQGRAVLTSSDLRKA